jgi:adenine-specific DNA-methyltransferase
VHLDSDEDAYCRVVMDEVFGRDQHIANVIWQSKKHPDNKLKLYEAHNVILVYGDPATFNLAPRTASYSNPDEDPRGPWDSHPLDAAGKGGRLTESLVYPIVNPNTGVEYWPKKGRMWSISREDMERLLADGRIYWGKRGTAGPRKKAFLSEVREGVSWSALWVEGDLPMNDAADRHHQAMFGRARFETAKPEELMKRIIDIASNPGDVVLDCFVGSGTTAAVAHKMGRRWVAAEINAGTVETFTRPRLEKVVAGDDPGGVTKQTGWQGGGGFRVLEVAPSMFAEVGGRVWLAEWAVDRQLAEATAAQLGFDFEPEPPFAGRKGRTRLAVVDGLVSPDVVELLVGALGPDEKLVLCGTAVDPGATERLRELSRGSRTRKIPASILAEYRVAREWRVGEAPAPKSEPVA